MIRVLLVDDEPAFMDMLKFFLERERDLSVDGVLSAREALEKLGKGIYDVIVSDYSMPDMDGVEFLKIVRIQGINKPFIMLTGRGREDVAIQALNYGANFYVQKRGDPKAEVVELVSAIRQSAYQREAMVSAQRLKQTVEAVVNASPLPIIAADLDGRITLWSRAAGKVFGWSAEEMVDQQGLLACDDLGHELKSIFKEALEGREISGLKVRLRNKTGSLVEVALSLAIVRDENGRPTGLVSVLRDMPPIGHIDDDILRSEDLYRILAESLRDSVYIVSRDLRIQYLNRVAAEPLHASAEEVLGQPLGETLRDDAWRAWSQGLDRIFERGESVHLDDYSWAGEENIWYDTWLIPLKDRNEEVIAVMGVSRDVTAIYNAQKATKESEAKLRMLTQNMRDMITQFDASGHILYASPSHKAIVGFDPEELVGVGIIDMVHPGDRGRMESYLQDVASAVEPEVVRFRCRKADGSYIWLESTGSMLRDRDGTTSGAVFGSRDISDRYKAEAALKTANEKLKLLSDLTRHDVENQMSVLTGWLEIAHQSIDDDAVLKVLGSALDAAHAISLQMEFASDYQDIGVKTPIWLSPKSLCEKSLEVLDLGAITIRNRLGGLELFADPLLEKVCANLLDNVVRHGVRVTKVDVWCEENDDGLLIVFEDDGVGIPVEDKGRVFEKGFGKGNGLGLYLARAVLAITGITIRETGLFGSGARFEMLVPKGRYRSVDSGNS